MGKMAQRRFKKIFLTSLLFLLVCIVGLYDTWAPGMGTLMGWRKTAENGPQYVHIAECNDSHNYSEMCESKQASLTSLEGSSTRQDDNSNDDSDARIYKFISELTERLENYEVDENSSETDDTPHDPLSDSKLFYRLKGKTSRRASLKEFPSLDPDISMSSMGSPYEERLSKASPDRDVSTGDLSSKMHLDKDLYGIITPLKTISSPENLSNEEPPPLRPTINLKMKRQRKANSPLVGLPRDKHWPAVLEPSDGAIFASINYSRYTPEDRQYLQEHLGVYEERAQQVGQVCRQHPTLASPTSVQTLVWDQKHQPNIVWCEISKVASSSWMMNFLRLAHYRENDTSLNNLPPQERDALRFGESQFLGVSVHFLVYRHFPAPNTTKERARVFHQALRLLIVRHPFSRLLSAYLDKMTSLTPKPKIFNFRELQLEIIRRYRPKNNNATLTFPTFEEFVQYVIDSTASLKTVKDWKKMVCWTPYWAQCGVCTHDFQMIMKLETMVEDKQFLVTLADLQELKQVHEWRNSKSSTNSTHIFFRQLSTHQMQQLHQRYLLDFQLFGYSLDEYLPLAKDAA